MADTKHGTLLAAAAATMAIALGACQGTGGALNGSPDGVPIAVESIDGPPDNLKTALASELVSAAESRKVEIAESSSSARYRVRGYLSAETDAQGKPALAYVWDVFDAEKRRARRLTGSRPIKTTSSSDPWSGLDKEALAKLAAESMDEIAGFLSVAKTEQPTVTAEAPSPSGDRIGLAAP
jgi:hypothetical protein